MHEKPALSDLVYRMSELGDVSLRRVYEKGVEHWYVLREVVMGEKNRFRRSYVAGSGTTPEAALTQALEGK